MDCRQLLVTSKCDRNSVVTYSTVLCYQHTRHTYIQQYLHTLWCVINCPNDPNYITWRKTRPRVLTVQLVSSHASVGFCQKSLISETCTVSFCIPPTTKVHVTWKKEACHVRQMRVRGWFSRQVDRMTTKWPLYMFEGNSSPVTQPV